MSVDCALYAVRPFNREIWADEKVLWSIATNNITQEQHRQSKKLKSFRFISHLLATLLVAIAIKSFQWIPTTFASSFFSIQSVTCGSSVIMMNKRILHLSQVLWKNLSNNASKNISNSVFRSFIRPMHCLPLLFFISSFLSNFPNERPSIGYHIILCDLKNIPFHLSVNCVHFKCGII